MSEQATREAILEALRALALTFPQQRIGQIVSNAMSDTTYFDVFYVPDVVLLDCLRKMQKVGQ